MSAAELAAQIRQEIEAAQERMIAAEERYTVQQESREAELGNKSTGQLALYWLQQPDTPWGRHAVCRAWLREYEPNRGIFERVS